jgi:hypothetical protein
VKERISVMTANKGLRIRRPIKAKIKSNNGLIILRYMLF